MDSKDLFFGYLSIFIILFNFAVCDVASDRQKCENQLIGLATCLPYVGGEANAPASDCCTGFKQVLRDSRECICLLIKDRDDPSLGLKINATRALSLPDKCKTPVNESITDCPTILHLPPNSPDAKVFDDFAKSASKSNTTTTTTPTSSASSSSGSSASTTTGPNSDGGEEKIWFAGLLIAMATVHVFVNQ
ncbi:non-specific lipid transfer protein GPI-anchored 6-like isoform X2 [Salvia hispanica]|uniref:non-specific lipid transfer protein GPI-anchored 6-like isoform X2 n=1 Tax=Salvia hispanica TaxID=49212 RepID=UPI0020092460|nr:non-specific lipid transfer protein GPI-anchored 6-like isoform X2 [Salvia hispanica]